MHVLDCGRIHFFVLRAFQYNLRSHFNPLNSFSLCYFCPSVAYRFPGPTWRSSGTTRSSSTSLLSRKLPCRLDFHSASRGTNHRWMKYELSAEAFSREFRNSSDTAHSDDSVCSVTFECQLISFCWLEYKSDDRYLRDASCTTVTQKALCQTQKLEIHQHLLFLETQKEITVSVATAMRHSAIIYCITLVALNQFWSMRMS